MYFLIFHLQVCSSASSSGNPVGKRDVEKRQQDLSLIACSRCCDVNVTNGVECNAKMCGIKGCKLSLKYG